MSDKVFTAIYHRNGVLIGDISIRKESEKLPKIIEFIESMGNDIQVESAGSILTITKLFDMESIDEANLFIESFFEFID